MKAKEDPRISRSKMAIFQAFTKLSQEKSIERITVSELCKKAGLARITFYKHFETKEQLIDALCEELFAHALEPLEVDKHLGLQEIASHLLCISKKIPTTCKVFLKMSKVSFLRCAFLGTLFTIARRIRLSFLDKNPKVLLPQPH